MADRYTAPLNKVTNTSVVNTSFEYDSAQRSPAFVDEFVQLLRYRDLVVLMAGNIQTTPNMERL